MDCRAVHFVVAFTLIPEYAFHAIGGNTTDHMGIECARVKLGIGQFDKAGNIHACRHHLAEESSDFLLPWRVGHYKFRKGVPDAVTPVIERVVAGLPDKVLVGLPAQPCLELSSLFGTDGTGMFLCHPARGAGTAPVEAYDSNRNAEFRMQTFGKVITRRGKVVQILRRCLAPYADPGIIEILILTRIRDLRNIIKPNSVIVALLPFLGKVLFIAHEKLHVGLAAGDKNFAHRYVGEDNTLPAGHGHQLQASPCRQRPKGNAPVPSRIRDSRPSASAHGNADLRAGLRRSPNGDALVPLEHHSVLKNICNLHNSYFPHSNSFISTLA